MTKNNFKGASKINIHVGNIPSSSSSGQGQAHKAPGGVVSAATGAHIVRVSRGSRVNLRLTVDPNGNLTWIEVDDFPEIIEKKALEFVIAGAK